MKENKIFQIIFLNHEKVSDFLSFQGTDRDSVRREAYLRYAKTFAIYDAEEEDISDDTEFVRFKDFFSEENVESIRITFKDGNFFEYIWNEFPVELVNKTEKDTDL